MGKQPFVVELAKRRKEMEQALVILESISNRLDFLQERVLVNIGSGDTDNQHFLAEKSRSAEVRGAV